MLCRVPHAVCVPHVVFLPGIPQQLSYPENAIHARVAVVVAENDDEDVGDDGDPHRPPRRRRIFTKQGKRIVFIRFRRNNAPSFRCA